jgi:hypothetical protein
MCRRDVAALKLGGDGRLSIEGVDGGFVDADVHPETTVFPWLVVLRYRVGGRRIESLTLPPQGMDTEAHRQLRLWLKWKAKVGAAGGA